MKSVGRKSAERKSTAAGPIVSDRKRMSKSATIDPVLDKRKRSTIKSSIMAPAAVGSKRMTMKSIMIDPLAGRKRTATRSILVSPSSINRRRTTIKSSVAVPVTPDRKRMTIKTTVTAPATPDRKGSAVKATVTAPGTPHRKGVKSPKGDPTMPHKRKETVKAVRSLKSLKSMKSMKSRKSMKTADSVTGDRKTASSKSTTADLTIADAKRTGTTSTMAEAAAGDRKKTVRRSTMRRSTVRRSTMKIDFDYVVQRKGKEKVCFGSGLERKFLDFDKNGLVSKHARCNTRQTFDNVGPGSYDISHLTSAFSKVLNQKTSNLGTVLGGRKAARGIDRDTSLLTPGPIYDIPTTFPNVFRQCCAPFNVSQTKTDSRMTDNPGVGTYKAGSYKRRHIAFASSFGGRKCLIPAVKIKCDPYFSDVCEKCGKTPEGDYWYLDMIENAGFSKTANKTTNLYLCRPCYNLEKNQPEAFSKAQIKCFKKIRNCSNIHYHGGCKARILLVSPSEIKKAKEREGYFALYFS